MGKIPLKQEFSTTKIQIVPKVIYGIKNEGKTDFFVIVAHLFFYSIKPLLSGLDIPHNIWHSRHVATETG